MAFRLVQAWTGSRRKISAAARLCSGQWSREILSELVAYHALEKTNSGSKLFLALARVRGELSRQVRAASDLRSGQGSLTTSVGSIRKAALLFCIFSSVLGDG